MRLKAQPPALLPLNADGPVARAYLLAHDVRVQRIDRLPLDVLKQLWTDDMALCGLVSLLGGPTGHDELVNYIAEMEFPDASRAREIHADYQLHRRPAIGQE